MRTCTAYNHVSSEISLAQAAADQKIVQSRRAVEIETGPSPTAAVIWLHGLGADGNDFAPIVPELDLAGWPEEDIFAHS